MTQSQSSIDVGVPDDQKLDSSHLRERLGLDAIVIESPNLRLVVSDGAVPLNSTIRTNKFLSSIQGNSEFNYSLDSEPGKQLLSFILSKHFLNNVSASSETKPVGITAGIKLTDPAKPGLVNIQQPQSNNQTEPASADTPQLNQQEATDRATREKNKENLFPKSKYLEPIAVFATSDGKKITTDAADLSIALILLGKVADQLVQEEIKSKNLLMSTLEAIAAKDFPDLIGMHNKSLSFEDLPNSIKESFERNVLSNWESYGFSSENDALNYIQSNPKLNVELNLVAFLKHRSPNDPPGINRGSAFLIKP